MRPRAASRLRTTPTACGVHWSAGRVDHPPDDELARDFAGADISVCNDSVDGGCKFARTLVGGRADLRDTLFKPSLMGGCGGGVVGALGEGHDASWGACG